MLSRCHHTLQICLATLAFAGPLTVSGFPADPTQSEYLFATGIGFPQNDVVRTFYPTNDTANFTYFSGASGAVTNGILRLDMSADAATLGWGNYNGAQPTGQIVDMGQERIDITLRIRQSCTQSVWTARLWGDGSRLSDSSTKTVTATGWTEIEFDSLDIRNPQPDGLELSASATNGTVVELEWIRLAQPTYEGYCREEFVLPTGTVWRAVADVGSANYRNWGGTTELYGQLYINGQAVERQKAMYLYHTEPVDISPYLQPGTNCIALYGKRIRYKPILYFQSKVILESGEVITLTSDYDWRYSFTAPAGWTDPGFNDSGWNTVSGGYGSYLNVRANREVAIPAYQGRLVIRHPSRPDLFYNDTSNVVVHVHIPGGLTNQAPVLHYAFGPCDTNGVTTTNLQSSVSAYTMQGASAVYEVALGVQSHGIYTLALSLRQNGGGLIEERAREPLVVLRRMPLNNVQGTNYTEGLNLVLEDEIDFTDPGDPHPWFESGVPNPLFGTPAPDITTPRIVSTNGLTYREVTSPWRGAGFSYRIEFDHPGAFYYLELEYPDNAKRCIEVCISSKTEDIWTNCQAGYGVETGGRFLTTGKMKVLRVLHVADAGPHSVDVINVWTWENAAAKSLKIYRVVGDLPSVGSGVNRHYGIHTERLSYSSGVGMNFGVGMPMNSDMTDAWDEGLTYIQRIIKDLVWQQETAERYAQYLKFSGQNCFVMGCHQYSEYNTPYIPTWGIESSRVNMCFRTMLANVLDSNDIDFYAGVELSQIQDVRTYANNAQIAQGHDTIWMVNRNGEQRYGFSKSTVVQNWLHPDVRQAFTNLFADLGRTFGHLSHFRGVHQLLGPMVGAGYYVPAWGENSEYDDPLLASWDDVSMALFENDTGLSVPVATNDLDRFARRAEFFGTNSTARSEFFSWRCEKVKDYLADVVQALRLHRTDLELVNALAVEDADFFNYYTSSGKSFDDIMKEFGVDVGLINDVDGLWVGRWTLSWRQQSAYDRPPSQNPYCWLARTSPDIISTFDHEIHRYVFARTSWDENLFPSGGYVMEDRYDHDILVESDWIMNGCKIRALPQPGSYHTREALIQGLITSDPRILLAGFTDLNINVGHEQVLRAAMKVVTHLPPDKFSPVLDTGLDTDMAIRQLTGDNESWFYVVNPCQWQVDGKVTLETDGTVVDLISSNQVAHGNTSLPITLEPFGIRAYKVTSASLDIISYSNELMESNELARLEAIPQRIASDLDDPDVVAALTDQQYTMSTGTVAAVQRAIADRDYAEAWSLLTDLDFWTLWQWPELPPLGYSTSQMHWVGRGKDDHWHTDGNWSAPGHPESDTVYLADDCANEPQSIIITGDVGAISLRLEGLHRDRTYTVSGNDIDMNGITMLGRASHQLTVNNTFTRPDGKNISVYATNDALVVFNGTITGNGIQLNGVHATESDKGPATYRLNAANALEGTYGGSGTVIRGLHGKVEVIAGHKQCFGTDDVSINNEPAEVVISLATNAVVYEDLEIDATNVALRVLEGEQDWALEVHNYVRGRSDGLFALNPAGDGGTGRAILRLKPTEHRVSYLPVVTSTGTVVECDNTDATLALYANPSYGSGVISGSGMLRKLGEHTLYVDTHQEYSGGTDILAGRVELRDTFNGSLPDAGPVLIAAGAVFDLDEVDDTIGGLCGEGTVELSGQSLTVKEGVCPGSSVGTLWIEESGAVTLAAGSTHEFELGPLSGANDRVEFSGSGADLALGGELRVENIGGMDVGAYTLFDLAGGTISGAFASTVLPTGFSGYVATSSGDVVLHITAAPSQYFLDISTSGSGSVLPGDGWYAAGSTASVTGAPAAGNHFVQWSGDVPEAQQTNNPVSLLMNRERSITGVFEKDLYTLSVGSDSGGTVTLPGEGLFKYVAGTAVALEAEAQGHQSFVFWSGSAVDAGKVADPYSAQTSVTLDGNYTVYANFTAFENEIPFQDSFEQYGNGAGIVGTNGWYGTPGKPAVATNLSYTASCSRPLQAEDHMRVMLVDYGATATNRIKQAMHTNVTMDIMVQTTPALDPALPRARIEAEPEAQVGLYIDGDGCPVVYHSRLLERGATSNVYTTVSSPVTEVSSSEWARVTLTLDYLGGQAEGRKYFKVQINDGPLLMSEHAFRDPSKPQGGGQGGPWFLCANHGGTDPWVSALCFSGRVLVDDLKVTATNPYGRDVLSVQSPFGEPVPEAGTHDYEYGSVLNCRMQGSPIDNGTTQQVCTGWALSGLTDTQGLSFDDTTNLTVVLTDEAALSWSWGTNVWLDLEVAGRGSLSASDAWILRNQSLSVTATPSNYCVFGGWSGDTEGCPVGGTLIIALMDRSRQITATFDPLLAPRGTPQWWLAAHGVGEEQDPDADGMASWEEWLADTDPTNQASVLALVGIHPEAGGVRIEWKGGSQATQYIHRLSAITNPATGWTCILTNTSETATMTNMLDTAPGEAPVRFYRIKATR